MNPKLTALCELQGGVFSRRDALACGYDDGQIHVRVRRGEWVRLQRGAFVSADDLPGTSLQPDDAAAHQHLLRTRAALVARSGGLVASHQSAAIAHGLPAWGLDLGRIHLTRTDRQRSRSFEDVSIHRLRTIPTTVMTATGVAAVSLAQAVVETAALSTFEAGVCVADAALHGARPPTTGPQATAPHATAPHTTGARVTGPQATGPQATGAPATGPQATAPHATGAPATRPQATAPHATGAPVTRPQATGPQATAPHTTGQQATGPGVTGARVTGANGDRRQTVGVTAADLIDALEALGSARGSRMAAEVVRFADARSESVGESRLRVLMDRFGLPAPVPQYVVHDPSGDFVGRVDFGFPAYATVVEFDGRVKYREDAVGTVVREKAREDALREAGYEVVRISWSDLDDPRATALRIVRALRRGRRRLT